jgi:SEC-C motif-containing protein
MRARYSAFARAEEAYLRRTWHPSTRPRRLSLDPRITWTGLEVLRSEADGDTGVVEFRAHHRVGSGDGVQHEVSRFVREQGQWLYLGPIED